MKNTLLLLLLLVSINCFAFAQMSDEAAVHIISTTKPLPNPLLEMPSNDRTKTAIFDQQLEALSVLAASKNLPNLSCDLIDTIIPYLGYTTSRHRAEFVHLRRYRVDQIEEIWPAFKIIMAIPNGGKTLRNYCFNTNNSLKFRLLAFAVLSYKDPQIFAEISESFSREMSDASPAVNAYISNIRNNTAGFWGDSINLTQ